MKFLMIGKARDALFTLPPGLVRQLTEASTTATIKQKKEGKFQEIYWIPGGAATVTIGECKTAEEMVKNFNEIPIATYFNYEIFQLADFTESMKIITEKFKEAEKMMASTPK